MVFILDRPDGDGAQIPLAYYQEVVQPFGTVSASTTLLQLTTEAQVSQLQFGEFTLGDTDCPSLTGHPDIRY